MTARALAHTLVPRLHDSAHDDWWASLDHGGMLIAPARLPELLGADLPPLSRFQIAYSTQNDHPFQSIVITSPVPRPGGWSEAMLMVCSDALYCGRGVARLLSVFPP